MQITLTKDQKVRVFKDDGYWVVYLPWLPPSRSEREFTSFTNAVRSAFYAASKHWPQVGGA